MRQRHERCSGPSCGRRPCEEARSSTFELRHPRAPLPPARPPALDASKRRGRRVAFAKKKQGTLRKSASTRRRCPGHATPMLRTPPMTTGQQLLLPPTNGPLSRTHAHAARRPCRQDQRADCYTKNCRPIQQQKHCLRSAARAASLPRAHAKERRRRASAWSPGGCRQPLAAGGRHVLRRRSGVHNRRRPPRQAPKAHAARPPARRLHERRVCGALPSRGQARAIAARVRASGRRSGRRPKPWNRRKRRSRRKRARQGRRRGAAQATRPPARRLHERRVCGALPSRGPARAIAARVRTRLCHEADDKLRELQGGRIGPRLQGGPHLRGWRRSWQGRRAAAGRVVALIPGAVAPPAARRAERVAQALAAARAGPPGGRRHRHVLVGRQVLCRRTGTNLRRCLRRQATEAQGARPGRRDRPSQQDGGHAESHASGTT